METEEYTEVEKAIISVINNFMLWYTTEEDRGIAREYIGEEHIDYNEWFTINKEEK